MSKLKNADMFSNEEGAIAKFFVSMAIFAASLYTSQLSLCLIDKKTFEWWGELLTVMVLGAVITVSYFITRFLAYRTKKFNESTRTQSHIFHTPHRKRNLLVEHSLKQRTSSYDMYLRKFFVEIAQNLYCKF